MPEVDTATAGFALSRLSQAVLESLRSFRYEEGASDSRRSSGQPLLIMDDARYVPLLGSDGSPIALLVAYGRQCSRHILNRWKQRPAGAPTGNINSTIVDQISRLSPTLPIALQKGNLFQVVGTPALLEGINTGTHALMQTSTGTLGTVVRTSNGRIAGQLRFAQSTRLDSVVSPLALSSLLNVVAGTMQLQRINERLDVMVKQIERLAIREEAGVMGAVLASLKILDSLIAEYEQAGDFSNASIGRLALVEQQIASIYERNRILIDRFVFQAKSVFNSKGRQGIDQATMLLQEEGGSAMQDMSLLTILINAQSKIDQLLLCNDLAHQPSFAEKRLAMVHDRTLEHQSVISGFPSMASLEQHARLCLGEMNWLQKNIFSRSSVNKVRSVSSFGASHQANETTHDLVPSFCMWMDENGIHSKLDRSPASA